MRAVVVVVGAGVAGTAAALAASRAGSSVTLVDGGTGASTLWTGAVDGVAGPSPDAKATADVLDVELGTSRLVTTAGFVRDAHGRDRALLPIGRAGSVGVVDCERPGWDAAGLARAAGEGFLTLGATVLRHTDERLLPAADFAARHDDEARLGWLAERLREALGRAGVRVGAILLPPCLGVERSRADALSKMVALPCGEAMALPGGPAGLRFERARDRAIASAGVEVVRGRIERVDAAGDRWRVTLAGETLDAGAVVVAAGGLVGGGLEYRPGESELAAVLPPDARTPFRCTLGGPLPIGARGRPLELPGSLFGLPPEAIAWPLAKDALMDCVGVLADATGRVAPGLYAAGEMVADAPRTWMHALESGLRAGSAAAAHALSAERGERPSASLAGAPASRP